MSKTLRVAQDALEGDYQLGLLYHPGSSPDLLSFSAKKNFNITITDVQTNFDVVVQDSSGQPLSLGIVNTGKNTANSLVVKIPKQDNFRITGTSDQIVGNLAAGDYSIVSFSVVPATARNSTRDPNITKAALFNPDLQTLKVQIDYTDGIGQRRTTIKDISVESLIAQEGNFTSRLSQTRTQTNTISGISFWWYVIGIIIIMVAIYIYRKHGNKIKDHYSSKRNKNSSKDPDWVSNERTRKEK